MALSEKKKVLVVDDSVFARKIVSEMISSCPDLEIIGAASSGTEALAILDKLNPDVITLDVEMPGINGIETLKRIMAEHPTPVVMVSSLTSNGAKESIQALSIGAVDVMAKPHGSHALGMDKSMKNELIAKVLAAAGVKLSRLLPVQRSTPCPKPERKLAVGTRYPIVVIASSTGGPRALRTIISDLPTDAGAAYIMVQHLPEGFSAHLARDLNEMTTLNVRESSNGDRLESGDLIFATAGYHTVFEKDGSCRLTTDPPLWGVRPSADVTIASLVPVYGPRLIGAILTGMGHDGANGMKLIKDSGGTTIAEHESTCVVYGMPKSAVELGAVDVVTPLTQVPDAISDAITRMVSAARKSAA